MYLLMAYTLTNEKAIKKIIVKYIKSIKNGKRKN